MLASDTLAASALTLIETPHIDQLAQNGLRYNNFHTTAMCSPTRTCLLTGRNHHTAGMGLISELSQGYPGYDGMPPASCGYIDNHLIEPPGRPEDGYHLTNDLTARAIEFIRDLRSADQTKPFFLYYCPGACHAPHQAPKEYIERYKGKFDQGWDALSKPRSDSLHGRWRSLPVS